MKKPFTSWCNEWWKQSWIKFLVRPQAWLLVLKNSIFIWFICVSHVSKSKLLSKEFSMKTLATRKSAKIPLPPSNSLPMLAVSLAFKLIHAWSCKTTSMHMAGKQNPLSLNISQKCIGQSYLCQASLTWGHFFLFIQLAKTPTN